MTTQKMIDRDKVNQRNRQIKYLKSYTSFLEDRIEKLEKQLARRKVAVK